MAKIIEIFSSVQGEGPYVGEKQLFVRFYGCNLDCGFCDEKKKDFFSEYASRELVERISESREETVSFTGGEPLLQAGFLREVLSNLREEKKIYLETNGVLGKELLGILDFVDIISMDFKLPSSTGLRPYWKEHSLFLKKSRKKEVFVKAVVTNETVLSDIEMAVSIIKGIDKNIPFIIQPVSYNNSIEKVDLTGSFFESAKRELRDVRIIPQVHKVLGVN